MRSYCISCISCMQNTKYTKIHELWPWNEKEVLFICQHFLIFRVFRWKNTRVRNIQKSIKFVMHFGYEKLLPQHTKYTKIHEIFYALWPWKGGVIFLIFRVFRWKNTKVRNHFSRVFVFTPLWHQFFFGQSAWKILWIFVLIQLDKFF